LAEGRIPEVPLRWITPNQAADRLLSKGTILIEGSGSFCGRSMIWNSDYENLFSEPVGYSNFCKRLDPLCGVGQAMVCWMQIRKAYREGIIQTFRTGTAFPNLDVHDLVTNLIVVVPTEAIANTFGKIFELSQRIDLMTYSLILVVLRDNLLPKLISGEIRVPDAEHLVETSEA
jgi:type I restriction enzyme S subunit